MKIRRTANAGVLLEMDGLSILLDGVCRGLAPYLETPDFIREELIKNFPDVVAFTHWHEDHYDDSFAKVYKELTLRSIFGPGFSISQQIGKIRINAIPTRHIGKTDVKHTSFIIEGSKCVLFAGDASPLQWKGISGLPKADVLILPYAYAVTDSAWQITKAFGAQNIVILHLPEPENDEYGLWKAVKDTTKNDSILIPHMGQIVEL